MDRQETITTPIRPEDEPAILAQTEQRLGSQKGRAASILFRNVHTLVRMLRTPNFHLALTTRVAILGALVYFLLPTDATPDYLPVIGFVDDTLVVGFIIKRLASEIERFKALRS